MRQPRTILAEYFTTENLVLLFLLREDFAAPELIVIEKTLDEVRDFVAHHFLRAEGEAGSAEAGSGGQSRRFDEAAYQEFLAPFVAPLLAATYDDQPVVAPGDRLWLVPHDSLHYLPLHAVKVEGRYLIESHPVCYSPSASVMKYCQTRRKGRRDRALVLGDSLGNLVHAREEARTIAELFHTTPHLGAAATRSLLLQRIEPEREAIDVLHFCCHGRFNADEALKSGIWLAPDPERDGREAEANVLTAEELFGFQLRADLVTLSACESGVNERRPGDELIGLTRALIHAGTPSVVVSLWQVDDLSTQMLMERFYRELLGGADKAAALQRAQLYLKDLTARQVRDYFRAKRARLDGEADPHRAAELDRNLRLINQRILAAEADDPPKVGLDWPFFDHPYYWAPFILVGDWK